MPLNKDSHLNASELKELTTLLSTRRDRDALIVELLLFTGARQEEISQTIGSDINLADKMIFIRGAKGSDSRELPLTDSLAKRLKSYLGENRIGSNDLLFPISTRRFRQIWQNFRLGDKSLHKLRHTFAIELFKRHRDIRLVQFALGHRNINNTLVYSSYVYKVEELKKLFVGGVYGS